MNYKASARRPLAAFLLTLAVVTGYVTLLHRWLLAPGPSNEFGQFLIIGMPLVLSATVYAGFVRDESASKKTKRFRTLAAAVLAPTIAWMLYVFVGFAFLDWRM